MCFLLSNANIDDFFPHFEKLDKFEPKANTLQVCVSI